MGPRAASEGGNDLDDILTWNMVRAARFVGHRLADRLSGHRLNPIQFGVLAFLEQQDEMTSAEIARAVLLRPQSVAPLLDGLEERGLISRRGTRARGHRNPVTMTDEGRRLFEEAREIALAANDLDDATLTDAESAELNRLLLKIVRSA